MSFFSGPLSNAVNESHRKPHLLCFGLLALIHFALDLSLGKQSHLLMSLFVWTSVFMLLLDKQSAQTYPAQAQPSKLSSFSGFAILSALMIVSMAKPGDKITGFFPLIAFMSWFFIFVDLKQVKQYAKELIILLTFGLPKLIPESAFGLSSLTAKFSAFLLHSSVSYPVQLVDNTFIQIPNGSVEVVPACSGISLIVHMLSISVIFLCLFPAKKWDWILLPLLATAIGFVFNAVRVAVLASLSRPESVNSFQYWHSASGASFFVLAALILYSALWFYLFRPVSQSA